MSGSRSYAVKKAVIDGLATHLGALDDFDGTAAPEFNVEVSYGYRQDSGAAERIFTNRAQASTPPAALRSGRNYRNETGTFDLTILVKYVGGDAEDAERRADAIGEKVEEWLADRKSNELGVTGLNTLTVIGWESQPLGGDSESIHIKTYTVQWTARLT